ncbi:3-hydroxyacyl-CoA dehydrogenase NAD-binding domain-containing protein [Fodinisporobacter ferrooxydans]|uniref:3-hydroxyacyl-CoA dehydrogenase NAD-binding domain-containing protein n=1 Tax=Fodinisporobacter ferrooxydans TaxID=2901836 RepID=A0ABY4CSF5_9BACL|nr:3-hydroxyacyl-CoA dehydrogenase NAD-binding domain-containing protein [Alicyclobacillaceae bacterium MYW30-H2]
MKMIGVIGAGTMGTGIAQLFAMSGYEVVFLDIKQQAIETGINRIKSNLERMVKKAKLSENQANEIVARIHGTTDWSKLATADYVTEAVPEKMTLKHEVYRIIESYCREEIIFATNTSGLSVTEIASVLKRPERLIVTHYFYPVPIMKLVELVRGAKTSDETVLTVKKLLTTLGKKCIEVKESPLFVVNRLIIPMINEAIFVLQEGICKKEEIDEAMLLGADHPVGPLALADIIGLDTLLYVIETLYTETNDPKYRPAPLLRQMVRSGNLGRKTGKGFYEYDGKQTNDTQTNASHTNVSPINTQEVLA